MRIGKLDLQKFSIHTHEITLDQEKTWPTLKLEMREIAPLQKFQTEYYDNIDNATYNLKQLILATNKFQKDDVDIRYASIDKRTSMYVTNNSNLRLKGDVAMILGFEFGAIYH